MFLIFVEIKAPSFLWGRTINVSLYFCNTGSEYKIKNNGHALQIDLPADTPYILKKGGKSYTPLQVHIHFDPVTGKGSEHTIDGKKYFAEVIEKHFFYFF